MEVFTLILIILGLSVFEIFNSVDNAIINADVLSTVKEKYRKWFLLVGMFFAVFVIRGVLPMILIWISDPSAGIFGAFKNSFSADLAIKESIGRSSPVLLVGAATFLLFLFFHWLFIEPKRVFLAGERFFHANFFLFYAFVSVMLTTIIWFGIQKNSMIAFGAAVGATAFYVVEAVRRYAEEKATRLHKEKFSDMGKIAYLEVLDATFSIDGVIGAFAFTLSVPLILVGNGIGALVVRQLTIKNVKVIHKLKYVKKGAMYSLFLIGLIMLMEGFGYDIPAWMPPLVTFAVVGYFFYLSELNLKHNDKASLK